MMRRPESRLAALLALLACACVAPPSVAPPRAATPSPEAPEPLRLPPIDVDEVNLALLPVDDDAEPFRGDEGGIGITTGQLTVPLGHAPSGEHVVATRFAAFVHKDENEDLRKTRERAQRFIATLTLPKERAFVLEHWVDPHEPQPSQLELWQGKAAPSEGYTLVLVETRPVLEGADFGDVELWHPPERNDADGYIAVIQLTQQGVQRLKAHHELAPDRRVALVHRGEALMTPVLLAAPSRLHVSHRDPELLRAVFGDLPVHEGLPPTMRTDAPVEGEADDTLDPLPRERVGPD